MRFHEAQRQTTRQAQNLLALYNGKAIGIHSLSLEVIKVIKTNDLLEDQQGILDNW